MEIFYSSLIIITGLLAGSILMWKTPILKKSSSVYKNEVKISVIIPARNEAHNLPNILKDLFEQSLVPTEVIVVNDQSEDDTLKVLGNFDVKVININGKPTGWAGKTFACQTGAEFSKLDILIFIDADVRLHKDALFSIIKEYQKNKCVISIWPYHNVERFYENFSLFFNLVTFYSTKIGIPFSKKTAGLYGPVILFDRDTFESINGFRKVKKSVFEDFELGLVLNSKNIKSLLLGGGELIKFQMYPIAFKELFYGFSKNISSGALRVSLNLKLIIFLFISAFCDIPLFIFQKFSLPSFLVVGTLYYILGTVFLIVKGRKIGNFNYLFYIFFPLPLLFFVLVFGYSFILKFLFRKAMWKGRMVDV